MSAKFDRCTVLSSLVTIALGCGLWLTIPAASAQAPAFERQTGGPAVPGASASPVPLAVGSGTAELARMRISSQTWRRGGLGSRALVTFTLRNDNDYDVKDLEVLCAFLRRDGTLLTERSRNVPGIVGMKGRKTFARVSFGVVNINADRAICRLVAARRA